MNWGNDRHLKWVIAGLCQYETLAIVTGKMPSITRITSRHRWLQPVITGSLAGHFILADRRGDNVR